MRTKKIVCFLSMLLLFSAVMSTEGASPTSAVSFRGAGVTIQLTFPEEAYPNSTVTHNITITSGTTATLRNFTVIISAPVNSSWQEIFNAQDTFIKPLPTSYNLTLSLPQESNGMLQCFIFVNTSSIDDLSTTFYTTLVSEPTFSEILASYNSLQANYSALLNEYNGLLVNYGSLLADYTVLLSQYNGLSSQYNAQVSTYQSFLATYNKLSDDYDALNANYRSKLNEFSALQSDYGELNSTRDSIQSSYNTLQSIYAGLNRIYTDLQTAFANLQDKFNGSENSLNSDRSIMFVFTMVVAALVAVIIYIKRKKQEPYMVIRKETVNVNPNESSDAPS